MIDSLKLFIDAWELFAHPTLAAIFAGMMLGLCGVWIVLRRMVFLSATLSQTAGFGVAAALAVTAWGGLAMSPLWGAMLVTTLAAWWATRSRSHDETLLSTIFLFSASGTVLLTARIPGEVGDATALLFGTALTVTPAQCYVVVGTAVAVIAVLAWSWRGLVAVLVDREGARVRGVATGGLDGVLALALAAAIAVTTNVLGALPAFAFSVFPAVGALAVARSVPGASLGAVLIGAASGGLGYVVAFLTDLPVGASQAMTSAALALGLVIVGKLRG